MEQCPFSKLSSHRIFHILKCTFPIVLTRVAFEGNLPENCYIKDISIYSMMVQCIDHARRDAEAI